MKCAQSVVYYSGDRGGDKDNPDVSVIKTYIRFYNKRRYVLKLFFATDPRPRN